MGVCVFWVPAPAIQPNARPRRQRKTITDAVAILLLDYIACPDCAAAANSNALSSIILLLPEKLGTTSRRAGWAHPAISGPSGVFQRKPQVPAHRCNFVALSSLLTQIALQTRCSCPEKLGTTPVDMVEIGVMGTRLQLQN